MRLFLQNLWWAFREFAGRQREREENYMDASWLARLRGKGNDGR